jgi:hypothetical protein
MLLQCECLEHCTLYSDAMVLMPGTAHLFREKYCAGNQHGCARYKAYQQLGEASVPADLAPHDHGRLREIVF